jgi:23S rRNA (cytosine1962-C5)-methyltransferase
LQKLYKEKEKSVQRNHPWIFSGAVYVSKKRLTDGQMVNVTDTQGNHLATGFIKGSIAVHALLTFAKRNF